MNLPDDLPVPVDDGACDHLPGRPLPRIALRAASGKQVDPGSIPDRLLLYCYPMTGRPGVPLPEGWAQIPGAMGCTPEACAFRDHWAEIGELGVTLCGLSTQDTAEQAKARTRLELPFDLLSDAECRFIDELGLPTFEAAGKRLVRRLTLVADDGIVTKVFYPVFPPDAHAEEVAKWLAGHPTPAPGSA